MLTKKSPELDRRLRYLVEQETPNYLIALDLKVSQGFVSKSIKRLGIQRKEWNINLHDKHTGPEAYKQDEWTKLLSRGWR